MCIAVFCWRSTAGGTLLFVWIQFDVPDEEPREQIKWKNKRKTTTALRSNLIAHFSIACSRRLSSSDAGMSRDVSTSAAIKATSRSIGYLFIKLNQVFKKWSRLQPQKHTHYRWYFINSLAHMGTYTPSRLKSHLKSFALMWRLECHIFSESLGSIRPHLAHRSSSLAHAHTHTDTHTKKIRHNANSLWHTVTMPFPQTSAAYFCLWCLETFLKGIAQPKNKNMTSFTCPCHLNPAWLSFFYETQNESLIAECPTSSFLYNESER